jgi:hypothetical protein
MPFNPYQTGGQIDRSGELLGRGIASAGASIGEGLRDAILQHKQNVQDAAAADTAFPMLTSMYQKAGLKLDPDVVAKFGKSGVSAKRGIIGQMATDLAMSQKQQQDQATMAETQARTGLYQSQQADKDADTQADAVAGNMFKDYMSAPTALAGVDPSNTEAPGTQPLSDYAKGLMTQTGIPASDHDQAYAAFKYAASRMPANAPVNRVMPKLIDSITKFNALKYGQNNDGETPKFAEDPVTGSRFATFGKEMQSSGTNPDKVTTSMGTAVPVNAPDGSLQGYNIPKGGKAGGFTFQATKDMTPDQKQNIVLGHQKEIASLMQQLPAAAGQTNIMNAINDQIGTHQKYIDQLQNGDKTAPPPASSALQTATNPKTGAKMVLKDGQWQPMQ